MVDTAIWWIRRDLRLRDNPALRASLDSALQVIPLFIIDPAITESPNTSSSRFGFLLEGLRQLDADLKNRGGGLILRHGLPVQTLGTLLQDSGAQAIFAEADFSPYARRRDKAVGEKFPLNLISGPSLSHPESILKSNGTPYTVFTPYMRVWKNTYHPGPASLIPALAAIRMPENITSAPIPAVAAPSGSLNPFLPGETAAQRLLNQFVSGEKAPIFQYADTRNRLDQEGTSQLSPYLRFGMLSAREAIVAAYEGIARAPDAHSSKGAETWLNELIWREFYAAILYHFPNVLKASFRADYRGIRWRNDPGEFDAWCQGQTGYPVVDAAMRQLLETGWMHNRARMITASFLVKDLLIDWRRGEHWFMQHLVDGDPAANNGGWQWTAGTGTDAAPYFRIFNPVLQGGKFDPEGTFVRKWLPELSQVPKKFIHAPWEMSDDLQRKAGCVIGKNYPPPIVDHAYARQRTLAAFKGE